MAYVFDDRVLETTTTTGTGALTLAGAVAGFKRFSAALNMQTHVGLTVGDVVPYFIEAVDANGNSTGDYESGIGTYSAANTLTRTTVQRSSNGNAAVSLAAGTKYVGIGLLSMQSMVMTDQGDTPMPLTSTPKTPAATYMSLFGDQISLRSMLRMIDSFGNTTTLQPFLGRNKIGYWNPPGNATTVPGVFGLTALTVAGTATARNVATTNVLTRMRRLGFVSAATAGSLASARVGVAQFTTGDGAGNGGFHTIIRFATSDAATVSGARAFFGLSSNTAAATNVEPSTLTNSLGIAQLSTDNTQWYLVCGGSAAQAAIPLGTTLGAPTLTTTAFEIALFCSASENGVIRYEATNIGTGVQVTGTITPATPGVQTPLSTTLLNHQLWRCNNATALAVGYDLCSVYVETDN